MLAILVQHGTFWSLYVFRINISGVVNYTLSLLLCQPLYYAHSEAVLPTSCNFYPACEVFWHWLYAGLITLHIGVPATHLAGATANVSSLTVLWLPPASLVKLPHYFSETVWGAFEKLLNFQRALSVLYRRDLYFSTLSGALFMRLMIGPCFYKDTSDTDRLPVLFWLQLGTCHMNYHPV